MKSSAIREVQERGKNVEEENRRLSAQNRALLDGAARYSSAITLMDQENTKLHNMLWHVLKAAGGRVCVNDLSQLGLVQGRREIKIYRDENTHSDVLEAR